MTTPENPAPKKRVQVWHILLIGSIVLVVGSKFIPDLGTPVPPASHSSDYVGNTSEYDDSWIPSDFSGYPDNDNVAWRWGTKSETNCTYDSGACWSVMLITRDGCPSGVYAEIAILDSSGVQIDFTNDTTTRVLPKTKVKLTFDTFNDDADTARLSEVSCR